MLAFEYIVVGLIVVICGVFSVWRLISARLRLRFLEALGVFAENAGGVFPGVLRDWLTRLRSKTVAQLAAGCSACGKVNAAFRPANRSSAALRR